MPKLAMGKTWRRLWPRQLSIGVESGTSGRASFYFYFFWRCGEFWEKKALNLEIWRQSSLDKLPPTNGMGGAGALQVKRSKFKGLVGRMECFVL